MENKKCIWCRNVIPEGFEGNLCPACREKYNNDMVYEEAHKYSKYWKFRENFENQKGRY
jgi:hypothetical protein